MRTISSCTEPLYQESEDTEFGVIYLHVYIMRRGPHSRLRLFTISYINQPLQPYRYNQERASRHQRYYPQAIYLLTESYADQAKPSNTSTITRNTTISESLSTIGQVSRNLALIKPLQAPPTQPRKNITVPEILSTMDSFRAHAERAAAELNTFPHHEPLFGKHLSEHTFTAVTSSLPDPAQKPPVSQRNYTLMTIVGVHPDIPPVHNPFAHPTTWHRSRRAPAPAPSAPAPSVPSPPYRPTTSPAGALALANEFHLLEREAKASNRDVVYPEWYGAQPAVGRRLAEAPMDLFLSRPSWPELTASDTTTAHDVPRLPVPVAKPKRNMHTMPMSWNDPESQRIVTDEEFEAYLRGETNAALDTIIDRYADDFDVPERFDAPDMTTRALPVGPTVSSMAELWIGALPTDPLSITACDVDEAASQNTSATPDTVAAPPSAAAVPAVAPPLVAPPVAAPPAAPPAALPAAPPAAQQTAGRGRPAGVTDEVRMRDYGFDNVEKFRKARREGNIPGTRQHKQQQQARRLLWPPLLLQIVQHTFKSSASPDAATAGPSSASPDVPSTEPTSAEAECDGNEQPEWRFFKRRASPITSGSDLSGLAVVPALNGESMKEYGIRMAAMRADENEEPQRKRQKQCSGND